MAKYKVGDKVKLNADLFENAIPGVIGKIVNIFDLKTNTFEHEAQINVAVTYKDECDYGYDVDWGIDKPMVNPWAEIELEEIKEIAEDFAD